MNAVSFIYRPSEELCNTYIENPNPNSTQLFSTDEAMSTGQLQRKHSAFSLSFLINTVVTSYFRK